LFVLASRNGHGGGGGITRTPSCISPLEGARKSAKPLRVVFDVAMTMNETVVFLPFFLRLCMAGVLSLKGKEDEAVTVAPEKKGEKLP
ncbi:hypothetical protein Tco_0719610, partial [Tanacetum coccineum]